MGLPSRCNLGLRSSFNKAPSGVRVGAGARLPILPALYLPKKTWRLASQTDPLEHLEESPGSR